MDIFQKRKQTAIKMTKYQWFSNHCQRLKRALVGTRHAVSLQKINIVKLWIMFWKLENAPRELLTRCIF